MLFDYILINLEIVFHPSHERYACIKEGIRIDFSIVTCIQNCELCIESICLKFGNPELSISTPSSIP